jgi:hypothetical protein
MTMQDRCAERGEVPSSVQDFLDGHRSLTGGILFGISPFGELRDRSVLPN